MSIPFLSIRNGQNNYLHRSKPKRKSPLKMLKEYSKEALQRTVYCPMDDNRSFTSPLRCYVVKIEVLRLKEVHLYSAALPLPIHRVLYKNIDFRPIKSPFPFVYHIRTSILF